MYLECCNNDRPKSKRDHGLLTRISGCLSQRVVGDRLPGFITTHSDPTHQPEALQNLFQDRKTPDLHQRLRPFALLFRDIYFVRNLGGAYHGKVPFESCPNPDIRTDLFATTDSKTPAALQMETSCLARVIPV